MILYIKHIDIEGPGTLGEFFKEKRIPSRIVDLGAGDRLPRSAEDYDAVISLGGPMNVYEEDKYPFLKDEDGFTREVLRKEIPFLGICLGSQILAKAARAKVTKSPGKEIGFFPVSLTREGKKDILFQEIKSPFDVYQWHEDMVHIPSGGALLATSERCPHQALKVGACAYGLQFHVEITDLSIREWSDEYVKGKQECAHMKKAMLKDYRAKKETFDRLAQRLYTNFLQVMVKQKAAKMKASA